MFERLFVYYYKALTLGGAVVSTARSVDLGLISTFGHLCDSWSNSPSIFGRTPLDAIAAQRLFEKERIFLMVNGLEYPPIRRPLTYRYIRVEYYTDMDKMYQGRWDCWADVPVLSTGELDISHVKELWGLDPRSYAIVDPIRWKEFHPMENGRLSPIAVHNNTYGGTIPLRFIESNLSRVTRAKRELRAHFLTLVCMCSAIYDLLRLRSYEEHQFDVPLPWLFLEVYNTLRWIHPKTQPYLKTRKSDLFVDGGQSPNVAISSALSRPTTTQLRILLLVKVVLVLWFVSAEVVACQYRGWN